MEFWLELRRKPTASFPEPPPLLLQKLVFIALLLILTTLRGLRGSNTQTHKHTHDIRKE